MSSDTTDTPLLTAASTTVSTWAKGGRYDADKTMDYGENGDAYMCWAGSASSMIAWWQNLYEVDQYANAEVETGPEDIFDVFVANWANDGNNVCNALRWWFAGTTTYGYNGNEKAGYYSHLFTQSSLSNTVVYRNLYGAGAANIANSIACEFLQGSILSLGIFDEAGNGHALTLYGIEQDSSTGRLTTIHVADSNDYKNNVFEIEVSFDEAAGYYKLRNSSYKGWNIWDYELLRAYAPSDTTAPTSPSDLNVLVLADRVTFSWTGSSEEGVFYEVRFDDTYRVSTTTELTVSITEVGTYQWSVRAIDSVGNSTGWVKGTDFAAPALMTPENLNVDVQEEGTRAVFSWQSGQALEGVTYELRYRAMGSSNYTTITTSETKYTAQLKTIGNYEWSVRATDIAGNETDWISGAQFTNDYSVPQLNLSAPTRTRVADGQTRVTFSWSCSKVASYEITVDGVTYSAPGTLYSLTLGDGAHTYSVKAMDSVGNEVTVEGSAFTLDATAPVLTLQGINTKAQNDGTTEVTFSWDCTEEATYTLNVNGESYTRLTETQFTLCLPNGQYSYSVTATDAAGNSSTSEQKPFTLDSEVSPLTLNPLSIKATAKGISEVVFSWNSVEKDGRYELTVNGKTYTDIGSANSYRLELPDGTYSYTLKGTYAAGNSTVVAGDPFTLDATPPVLMLKKPQLKELGDGTTQVTLSWSAPGAARCELTVDGELQQLTGNSCTLVLATGSHSYTISAWDIAGNRAEESATLTVGSFAEVTLLKSNNKGKGTVAISWEGEEGAGYELKVGGKTYKLGRKTSWKGSLRDGEQAYTLTTIHADGSRSESRNSFTIDATAPRVTGTTATTDKETRLTTLSWASDADAVFFDIMKGKTRIERVEKGNSCAMALEDGKYSYTLVATDASGNSSKTKLSFKVDTTPVNLKNAKASVKKGKAPGSATVTLSWKGESKATYTVKVYDTMGTADTSDDTLVRTEANLRKSSVKLTNMAEKNGASAYRYTIEAWDQAGNDSMLNSTDPLVVDTVKPLFADLSAPANKSTLNTTATLSWTGVVGETYTLKVGKKTETIIGMGELITRNYEADGKYSYTLTAVDQGKNKTSVKGTFTVDTTAPSLSKVSAKGGKVSREEMQVTLSWKGESKAIYTLTDDETQAETETRNTSSKLNLGTGAHSYTLTATDLAGNASSLSVTLTVDVATKSVSVATQAASLDRELALSSGSEVLADAGLAAATLPGLETDRNELRLLA